MSYLYFSHATITNKMVGVHMHKRHELYYLAKGRTKYLIGDEIYSVEQGNVVFVPKGIYHMTDSGGKRDIERYLLAFEEDMFDKDTLPLLDVLFSERLINVPVNRVEGLVELFLALERSMDIEGDIGDAVRKIHVLSIISYICRHKRRYVPKLSEAEKLVHEVSEYVSAHYGEDLDLAGLSLTFSVSESYLSRKFKEVSGVGLNEYLTYVRIMNAEKLLRAGGLSITEVAERCGFNDSNYFSTVFKRIKGITPLRFSKTCE